MRARVDDEEWINVDTDDVNVAIQKANERLLEKQLERKQRAYEASPEFQPGATLEKENMGWMGSVARGVQSGAISIPANVLQTAGLGLQALGQEEIGEDIERRGERFEERYGYDIEGLGNAALIPKLLIQFGLPAAAVLRATKGLNKPLRLLLEGAAEATVADSDMKSIGNLWGGPTATRELADLEGKERVFEALKNKGKIGTEAATAAVALPLALRTTGVVIKETADMLAETPLVGDALRMAASGIRGSARAVSNQVKEYEKTHRGVSRALGWFRFRGDLPDKTVAEIKAARAQEFLALDAEGTMAYKELNEAYQEALKTGRANEWEAKEILDTVDEYLYPSDELFATDAQKAAFFSKQRAAEKRLIEMDESLFRIPKDRVTPGTPLKNLQSPISIYRGARRIRENIDYRSKEIARQPDFVPEGVEDVIKGELGLYGARQYRAFLEDNYVPTPEATEKAIGALRQIGEETGNPMSREEAQTQLFDLINKKGFSDVSVSPGDLIEDRVLGSILSGPLKGRVLNNAVIRDFLGEYTGKGAVAGRITSQAEREAGLFAKTKETLGRQASVMAKTNYMKALADYNDLLPQESKFLLREAPPDWLARQAGESAWVRLGDADSPAGAIAYGPLKGMWVKREYAVALENAAKNRTMPSLFNSIYATYLGLKGISQLTKTIYNPTGQVRNVSTASFFTVSNGNIPAGQTLTEAFESVGKSLTDRNVTDLEWRNYWNRKIRMGVVGTQAKIRETEDLFKDVSEMWSPATGTLANKSWNWVRNRQNGFMGRLYVAGDDVWKIFNSEVEFSKLKNMVGQMQSKGGPFMMQPSTIEQIRMARSYLGDAYDLSPVDITKFRNKDILEFLEEEAALITRDVIPNYARVPTAIQALRRLPLGNFIAYPAEIIRTTGNITGRSIKEISSDNPLMRARGIERLMGLMSSTWMVPQGVHSLGLAMTGSNEEQVQAYQRSFAPEWDKNSNLVPVKTDKDGFIKEFFNGSYTFPYDYLARVPQAVFNAVNTGIRKEEDLTEITMDALYEAYREFLTPYFGESMITERILDIRSGRTRTGYELYDQNALPGDKLWAGFAHVLNGLVPEFFPAQLSTHYSPAEAVRMKEWDRVLRWGDLPMSVMVESGLKDPRFRVTRGGEQLDFLNEAGQAATGVKTIRTNIPRNLKFKAFEASSEMMSANEDYNNFVNAHDYRIPREAFLAYQEANMRRYKGIRDLTIAVDDARILGMKDVEIIKILRDNGVSNFARIMNHTYIPYLPPGRAVGKALQKSEERIGKEIPVADIVAQREKDFETFQLPPQEPVPPRPVPLLERMKTEVPQAIQGAKTKASEALRQAEINKLLGIGGP